MSTTTTNYGLIKPDTTDPILIGQLNDNLDAIDAALKENADAIENKPDAADIPTPSTAAPAMDGTASPGTSEEYARADHIHPSDTSKASATSEAEDRAALVELVDSGAKNILDVNTSFTTGTSKGVTYTNNGDQTYTITTGSSGSAADDSFAQLYDVNADNLFGVKKGEKVVISSTSNSVACAIVPKYSGGYGTTIRGYKDRPIEYIIPSNFTGFLLRIGVTTSGTVVDENVGFMICTKAAWDISHEHQPHRPSYQELYDMVKALQAVT